MDGVVDPNLAGIDQASLTPIVRRSLGSETAEITFWQAESIYGGGGGGGIYRFSGKAQDRGETIPWSVIHKIIRAAVDEADPTAVRYWAREPLAYGSEALVGLPAGLVAPRCYGVVEAPLEYRFWLEDIADESGPAWPLERYGLVARQLARFNAAYLMGTPLPAWPWLSRGCTRSFVSGYASNIAALRNSPDRPEVRRWYPGEMLEQVLRLWNERETLLDALDRLPQTLCHMDVHRRNLLMRRLPGGEEQMVAIDWAFMGTGAFGEEIAPLAAITVGFFEVETEKLEELDALVFDGYLAGLHDAGWRGETKAVRFAYTAATALRFALPVGWDLLDVKPDPLDEQIFGRPRAEIVARWVELRRFLFTLVDEARELLDTVRE